MGQKGENLSKERAFSIPVDVIRTVAIVGVILLHSANDLTSQQMSWFEIIRWNTVTVYQSIGRLGVPLFLLLTGALFDRNVVRDTIEKRVACYLDKTASLSTIVSEIELLLMDAPASSERL